MEQHVGLMLLPPSMVMMTMVATMHHKGSKCCCCNCLTMVIVILLHTIHLQGNSDATALADAQQMWQQYLGQLLLPLSSAGNKCSDPAPAMVPTTLMTSGGDSSRCNNDAISGLLEDVTMQ